MGNTTVNVMTKKELMGMLDKSIPDDAYVMLPAWGNNGKMMGASLRGKKHSPYWDIRMFLASDILNEPEFVSSIMALHFAPVTWMTIDKAQRFINKHGFDLLKVVCSPKDDGQRE